MAALTMSTSQAALIAKIQAAQADPASVLNGIPFAQLRFGQPEPDLIVNPALSEGGPGVCLLSIPPLVSRIESLGNSAARYSQSLTIFILENRVQNLDTANGGIAKDPLVLAEAIQHAVVKGKMAPTFILGSAVFDTISENSAAYIWPLEFILETTFNP